jgi:hypothetical protein
MAVHGTHGPDDFRAASSHGRLHLKYCARVILLATREVLRNSPACEDHRHLTAREVSCEWSQAIKLVVSPAIFPQPRQSALFVRLWGSQLLFSTRYDGHC